MRIRFEFPVRSALTLKEHWPVTVAEVTLEWRMQGDAPIALTATFDATEKDKLPSIVPSVDGKAPTHIDMGYIYRQDEVEQIVRSFYGLLGLFVTIDIDLDHYETTWQPETDEERSRLQLYSFRRNKERADIWAPHPLPYDLVARAMASAERLGARETTLAFLRRGIRAFHTADYIQAFYNFFFFIETQFAGGYSNQRQVIAALTQADPIKESLRRLRSGEERVGLGAGTKRLLALTDDDLIKHLVKTRGDLHHHALRRADIWHPDKPHAVESEADILQLLVHSIALKDSIASLFENDVGTKIMSDAVAAGATVRVKVIGHGIRNGTRISLQPTIVTAPGRVIDRQKVHAIFGRLRTTKRYSDEQTELVELTVRSEDEREIYSKWSRIDWSPEVTLDDRVSYTQAVHEKIDIDIWFLCTIELRPELTVVKGVIAQEHGRACRIRLRSVPVTQVVDGRPGGRILELAELEFLRQADNLYPDHDILVWEARLGESGGPTLSRYESYASR